MIQFPETAKLEWETVANAAVAAKDLHKRIKRDAEIEREVERLHVRHEAALTFQQDLDADNTPALEMMTLTNYKGNPAAAPKDMIEGVMKAEGLCIVLGPSGSGKSTLALTMLHSLMSGENWLGQTTHQINGAVGVVSYDMDAAMMLDWMSGFPNIDPTKVSVVNAHKRGNPLAVRAIREQIVTAWQALAVEVIIIDSFSASFFGHDQNDAAATMAHYRELLAFSRECGAKSLVVITHSTESNPLKARGSTVHHDVADTIVSVAGQANDPRLVRMVKYRAALNQQQMNPVIITPPDVVTHLVELDYGAMSIAGMALPANVASMSFPSLPDTHDDPDVDDVDDVEGEDGEWTDSDERGEDL